MAKVSVLVPIYNVEKYLRECLDSVIKQTLEDIEIVLINDGSKDGSLKIIKEYAAKDKRIKVINKENSGYGSSMNLGLKEAGGEYIGIVESDDFVKDTMFENLYKLAQEYNSDIVKSEHYEYITQNGKGQARKTSWFSEFKKHKPLNIKDSPELIGTPPNIWSAIYRKDFLDKNNIRFLETPGASYQDTSFSFKAFALGERIILSNKAYLYYRQDNEGSSVKSKGKVYAVSEEYEEINNFLKQNPEIKKAVNTEKLIKEYRAYIWNLRRIDESFRDEFTAKFKDTFATYLKNNEIKEKFYKKVDKDEFNLLISDTENFKLKIKKQIEQEKLQVKRRKLFSVRIGFSRISIILFGKHIVEWG